MSIRNGAFAKDPFKFENAKIEKVILRQNGTPVIVESHYTDIDNDNAKEAYFHVCQTFDVDFNSHDINLTHEQFLKGSTIWAGTFSSDTDANNSVALLQKPANFEADIQYMSKMVIPKVLILQALFIGKFAKTVLIGEDNKVSLM